MKKHMSEVTLLVNFRIEAIYTKNNIYYLCDKFWIFYRLLKNAFSSLRSRSFDSALFWTSGSPLSIAAEIFFSVFSFFFHLVKKFWSKMSTVRQKTESSAKVLQTEIKNLTMQPLEGFEIAPCYGLKFEEIIFREL